MLNGNDGDDSLIGGVGDDQLLGGPDDDTLRPDEGADRISGGAGIDRATYADRSDPLTISVDNVANDGVTSENDDVRTDVEEVAGGDGNDNIVGSRFRNVLLGGAGDDTLEGANGFDTLEGGTGADVLNGANGDDLLDPGRGRDRIAGGNGNDEVTYAGRQDSLKVTLDGTANDGAKSEGDNVATDVENITGGDAVDTLIGNGLDNQLTGGPGGDNLRGGDGSDALIGGGGGDLLNGGLGVDTALGGAGNDLISTADRQADEVQCGAGRDQVTFDRTRDRVAADCEALRRK